MNIQWETVWTLTNNTFVDDDDDFYPTVVGFNFINQLVVGWYTKHTTDENSDSIN